MDCGSRPWAAADSRTLLVYFLQSAMVVEEQKIASACLPPNSMPDFEAPAWKINGVRWRDGCVCP